MQADLGNSFPGTTIRIYGVDGAGNEGGVPYIAETGVIPWLQDRTDAVWDAWAVTYRDVVVLDEGNRFVAAYNLTTNDLSLPGNYAALRQILVDAASD